ncbi:hypothetical protein NFJ02_38g95340 [Pycnococcus provasolii]
MAGSQQPIVTFFKDLLVFALFLEWPGTTGRGAPASGSLVEASLSGPGEHSQGGSSGGKGEQREQNSLSNQQQESSTTQCDQAMERSEDAKRSMRCDAMRCDAMRWES